MDKPRLAWAITGSGHYIEECLDFLLTQDNVDLYLSLAGEEVLLMYGISLDDIRKKMPVYRDKTASAPPVGHFYKGLLPYLCHGADHLEYGCKMRAGHLPTLW